MSQKQLKGEYFVLRKSSRSGDMTIEIWKPIVLFKTEIKTIYSVSSSGAGSVRLKARSNQGNVKNSETGDILTPQNNDGYLKVKLSVTNPTTQKTKTSNHSIHRLVAKAFLDNPEDKLKLTVIQRSWICAP